MSESYCPTCGRVGVIVGLDCVLLETRPEVRRHACGLGGPGASALAEEREQDGEVALRQRHIQAGGCHAAPRINPLLCPVPPPLVTRL